MSIYFLFADPLSRIFCGNCNKSYKTKIQLGRHVKYECGKEPTLVCFICLRKFYQKYRLNDHLRTKHRLQI